MRCMSGFPACTFDCNRPRTSGALRCGASADQSASAADESDYRRRLAALRLGRIGASRNYHGMHSVHAIGGPPTAGHGNGGDP